MNIRDSFVEFDLPDTSPYTNNFDCKNSVQLWSGSDSQERFESNMKDQRSHCMLQFLGWDTANITYVYNSDGFRDQEFDDRPCGIAVGCSFTEGVGLPVEATWPKLLSDYTGTHVWNLGVGGASIDTVFRIVEYYVVALKPKFVCVLMPPPMRFEYKDHSSDFSIISVNNFGPHPAFSKDWLSHDYNGEIARKKTMLAIDSLCRYLKIPLVFNDGCCNLQDFHVTELEPDLARDLMHSGVKYQKYQADYMFSELKKWNIK
jgi:hypothetical protein